MGAWGLRPRQAWGWGCAAVGGGNPNPLLAPLQREFYCVLIAYQIADNEEYPRGSFAYTCACSVGTFCCRQRVPKAFGRIAIRRFFPLYRCISFLKKYRQGYNEKGVTSDTSPHRAHIFCYAITPFSPYTHNFFHHILPQKKDSLGLAPEPHRACVLARFGVDEALVRKSFAKRLGGDGEAFSLVITEFLHGSLC